MIGVLIAMNNELQAFVARLFPVGCNLCALSPVYGYE